MFDSMTIRRLDEPPAVEVPAGMTAREVAAAGAPHEAAARRRRATPTGSATREFVDSFYYTLFPNFHPWGAFNRIVYRFRPYGTTTRCRSWSACTSSRTTGERAAGPRRSTGSARTTPGRDAPELGLLARVFTQDTFNLPKVQRGLKAAQKPGVTLANYQEAKIRHFHHLLKRYISA